MIRGVDNVVTWFEDTKNSYWAIYPKGAADKGVFIAKSDETEGVSPGDAKMELQRKLALLSRGVYVITSSENPKRQARGHFQADFEVEYSASGAAAPAQVSGTAMSDAEIDRRIQAGIDKFKQEQEIERIRKENEELKKENKELEKKANDPWTKIADIAGPHLPQILGINQPPAAAAPAALGAVAGSPDDNNLPEETTELTPEQQETVSNFLTVLVKHDPDWQNTLNRIAAKIEQSPSVIAAIKTFI